MSATILEENVKSGLASKILGAAQLSVYGLFRQNADRNPSKLALADKNRSFTYAEVRQRVEALAASFEKKGIQRGDRVAILSENKIEYIETHLALGLIGASAACQNWRLSLDELDHCINLVTPKLLVYSERFDQKARDILKKHNLPGLLIEKDYGSLVSAPPDSLSAQQVDWEEGLLMLYTSGTTGPAKAAVISHRALINRMILFRLDLEVDENDSFLAWAPMFHMGGSEHSISTLMMGGTVFVADGFDVDYIVKKIAEVKLSWLILVPATIDRLLERIVSEGTQVAGIKRVGAMADLLPRQQIADVTNRLNSEFLNSFGATETGIAPASRGTFRPGALPESLSKLPSSLCSFRIVDSEGRDVPDGEVGELLFKGPTLFSGYWGNEDANEKDFVEGGWFRMGDLFKKNSDGTLDFSGRKKYLIKSGGENIYPAEIEAVILSNPSVTDAIVVSMPDQKWGEIPVAIVAASEADHSYLEHVLLSECRSSLAGYKVPKLLYFINFDDLPRSSSGKIVRADVEEWLKKRSSH